MATRAFIPTTQETWTGISQVQAQPHVRNKFHVSYVVRPCFQRTRRKKRGNKWIPQDPCLGCNQQPVDFTWGAPLDSPVLLFCPTRQSGVSVVSKNIALSER